MYVFLLFAILFNSWSVDILLLDMFLYQFYTTFLYLLYFLYPVFIIILYILYILYIFNHIFYNILGAAQKTRATVLTIKYLAACALRAFKC